MRKNIIFALVFVSIALSMSLFFTLANSETENIINTSPLVINLLGDNYVLSEKVGEKGIPNIESTYTSSTETHCINGKCEHLIHSMTKFAFEDEEWKSVEDAKSLKNKGFEINFIEEDPDYSLEVIDFNYTHITVKLDSKLSKDTDLKVWKYNGIKSKEVNKTNKELKDYYKESYDKLKEEKIKKEDFGKEFTYELGIGRILEFGDNSTTIKLQTPDTENLADILYADDSFLAGSQIKWNITSVPASKTIDNATLCLFIKIIDGSPDSDVRIWRIDDQTWDESSSAGTIEAQSLSNQTDGVLSSISLDTWSCMDVTKMIQTDYGLGNDNASIRLEDVDVLVGTITLALDDTGLHIGNAAGVPHIAFNDKEGSLESADFPYLNVTYSEVTLDITKPKTASPESVSSLDNITTYFNLVGASNITSGVSIENVFIGGVEAIILGEISEEFFIKEDTFVEGSNTYLDAHTPTGNDAGIGWTLVEQTGSPKAQVLAASNNIWFTPDDSNDHVVYTLDDAPGTHEYNISITTTGTDAGDDVSFLVSRYTDATHTYQAVMSETASECKLRYINGGSVTLLDTASSGVSNGDRIVWEITNTSKNVYKNGALWLESTDNTVTVAGKGGLGCGDFLGDGGEDCYDNSWKLDDFNITYEAIVDSREFAYVSGVGWQTNVTVPTFASGLKDLFINATYSGTTYNDTETEAISYGVVSDSCATLNNGEWYAPGGGCECYYEGVEISLNLDEFSCIEV